ncbi:MAG: hypothetical protein B6U85_05415 [Desulfurococcales archaeon ex4484_42]|nr:MAG: hypothetical protein B6U85_05415 [Desulfurococcales archaeon ex4484_42]
MTELYPVLTDNKILVVGCSSDITKLCDNEQCNIFLWVDSDIALNINPFIINDVLRINDLSLYISSWLESVPYLNIRSFNDIDDIVNFIAKRSKKYLEGKTVVLGYSGGKDSTAALILITKLMEYLNIKLKVMYVYMPYIESTRNLKFVEYVSRRLSINIEIIEPKRRYVRKTLKWLGLPRRGNRWCTYFKVRPIRKVVRGNPKVIEAIADRLFESPKRALRLIKRLKDGFIASERKFTPVEFMPITDVMFIVKKWGLIHPAYMDGLPRVSCTLCPYKTLYEFNVVETLEDPGLIDEVLLKEYRKSYVYSKIPFEEFISNALWRFKPNTALKLYKLKGRLRNYLDKGRILSYRRVKDLHIMSWNQCEKIRMIAEFVRVDDLVIRVEKALNIGYQ